MPSPTAQFFRSLLTPTGDRSTVLPTKYIAIDTETNGLRSYLPSHAPNHSRAFAISACTSDKRTFYWEDLTFQWRNKSQVKEIHDTLWSYPSWIFANAKFDLQVLSRIIDPDSHNKLPITPAPLETARQIEDVLVAAHVLGYLYPALKPLSHQLLDFPMDDQAVLKHAVHSAARVVRSHGLQPELPSPLGETEENYWLPRWLQLHHPDLLPESSLGATACSTYSINDAIRTALLWEVLRQGLISEKLALQYHREMSIIPLIMQMEQRGVQVHATNFADSQTQLEELTTEIARNLSTSAQRYGMSDFNPRSVLDCQHLLFQHLKLPPSEYTKKGDVPSTSASSLSALAQDHPEVPEVEMLLQYRQAESILRYLNTYSVRSYNHSHVAYIHFPYRTTGPRTTRLSSSLGQNIAKNPSNPLRDLRRIFTPRPKHYWIDADYNQLELRILAVAAKEPSLLEAFRTDSDVHQLTADAISRLAGKEVSRSIGKRVNFSFAYGAKPRKLESIVHGEVPGQVIYDALCSQYPFVMGHMKRLEQESLRTGHVRTLGGYRLTTNYSRPYASLDYQIQGTAGDIFKNALCTIWRYLTAHCHQTIHPIFAIHDQLVFEVRTGTSPRHIRALIRCMESAGDTVGVHTPVEVQCIPPGCHWSEAQPWKGEKL